MFDIGASELLVVVIVAVLVIGPKDMPMALRTAGRWIGKVRRVSSHFRTGVDAMIREAELEEMEQKWKAQNEAIMAKASSAETRDLAAQHEMTGPPVGPESEDVSADSRASSIEHDPDSDDPPQALPNAKSDNEPELPLGQSGQKD